MTIPFCKDCRWVADGERCHAPQNRTGIDSYYVGKYLVAGVAPAVSFEQEYCFLQRSMGWFDAWTLHRCGRAGRWFKRAEPQNDTEKPKDNFAKAQEDVT